MHPCKDCGRPCHCRETDDSINGSPSMSCEGCDQCYEEGMADVYYCSECWALNGQECICEDDDYGLAINLAAPLPDSED